MKPIKVLLLACRYRGIALLIGIPVSASSLSAVDFLQGTSCARSCRTIQQLSAPVSRAFDCATVGERVAKAQSFLLDCKNSENARTYGTLDLN